MLKEKDRDREGEKETAFKQTSRLLEHFRSCLSPFPLGVPMTKMKMTGSGLGAGGGGAGGGGSGGGGKK